MEHRMIFVLGLSLWLFSYIGIFKIELLVIIKLFLYNQVLEM